MVGPQMIAASPGRACTGAAYAAQERQQRFSYRLELCLRASVLRLGLPLEVAVKRRSSAQMQAPPNSSWMLFLPWNKQAPRVVGKLHSYAETPKRRGQPL